MVVEVVKGEGSQPCLLEFLDNRKCTGRALHGVMNEIPHEEIPSSI